MIKNFRHIENSYIENFSKKEEKADHIVYWDEKLPDMYAFNCTLVKDSMNRGEVLSFIAEQLKNTKTGGKGFLKVLIHPEIVLSDDQKQQLSAMGFSIQTNLYMEFNTDKINTFRVNSDCKVIRASKEKDFEYGQRLDVETSTKLGMPEDFALRKSLRKKEVFQSVNGSLYSYLCYYNNCAVGKCELHIKDGYAKIEDFDVLEMHRGKGIGTAILKKIIEDMIYSGIEHIYLITDKDDTPQEMYKKLGFSIIGEEIELFWSKTAEE
ncbi:MAG: GNAT family N-acetyltransferase [Bacillota bacterium]